MKEKSPADRHPSSYISPRVCIDAGATVGPNCYIDGDIAIAKGAVLLGGITLIGALEIGENCTLEPGVCIANDYHNTGAVATPAAITIGPNVHIGAGSVLVCGISIGMNARIAPGTIVSRCIPPYAIVQGNPGVIIGYSSGGDSDRAYAPVLTTDEPGVYTCSIAGVTIHRFKRIRDLRGDLSVGEFSRNVPFRPMRYFLVYDVPSEETRGEHAHRECQQFLTCVAGSVTVVVDDGVNREEILLNSPTLGLYVPAGVWAIQYKYSADGVLLVFASNYYDPDDYIRDYGEYLREKGLGR
jgi:UDP-2-acetamido-3-amino-2,3-dideoxy-glucuronate N-acetyltransferase